MTNSMFRASDEDRARTVETLQQHTVAGRISFDEPSERCASAYQARTVGELAALTADLPRAAQPGSRTAGVVGNVDASRGARHGPADRRGPRGHLARWAAFRHVWLSSAGGSHHYFAWVPAMAVPARYSS